MLYQTALGVSILWQLKNQFSSFCPKHCFLNQGSYDGKSWTKYIHIKRHQIDHQLQVVAEWVSLFPRCFHPGHVEQTSFLRPPKLSQGSWWVRVGGWLYQETRLHPGYRLLYHDQDLPRNRLNHKLNSLRQWVNWLKNMFHGCFCRQVLMIRNQDGQPPATYKVHPWGEEAEKTDWGT